MSPPRGADEEGKQITAHPTQAVPESRVRTPTRGGPLAVGENDPSWTLPELPEGALDERLASLLSWVRTHVALQFGFVVDDEGLALIHESAPPELIAAAAELGGRWDALRARFDLAQTSRLVVHLEDRNRLHLLSIQTGWGRLSLGLVMEEPLPRRFAGVLEQGFRKAFSEKEHLAP